MAQGNPPKNLGGSFKDLIIITLGDNSASASPFISFEWTQFFRDPVQKAAWKKKGFEGCGRLGGEKVRLSISFAGGGQGRFGCGIHGPKSMKRKIAALEKRGSLWRGNWKENISFNSKKPVAECSHFAVSSNHLLRRKVLWIWNNRRKGRGISKGDGRSSESDPL